MTNLLATSKSGDDWTHKNLADYRINVTNTSFQNFFPQTNISSLPPLPTSLEPFISTQTRTQAPNDAVYKFLHYLDLAQGGAGPGLEPEEVAVDVFADRLMHLLAYDQGRRLILTRHGIPARFCGIQYSVTTDVCVCDENEIILLLLKDDKTRRHGSKSQGINSGLIRSKPHSRIHHGEAEAVLIASAISAFQRNNYIRGKIGHSLLEEECFPGIVMAGTLPTFYRVKVTTKLSQAVEAGTHMNTHTEVHKLLVEFPGPKEEGMTNMENRKVLLQYFLAFKAFLL